MREPFITQDGTRIERAVPPAEDRYSCFCHARMGNEFYFLPKDACLRDDKTCDKGSEAI